MGKGIANSKSSLAETFGELQRDFEEHKYLRVTWTTKRNRTIDQNALWASLYRRISETLGTGTAADIAEIKSYCKLMIGVPILRRDCEQFEKGWRRYFAMRSYEEQLFLMGGNPLFGVDGFPVTRLLDTKQGAEYTDAVVNHYAPLGVYFEDLLDGNAKSSRIASRKKITSCKA